MAVQIQLRRGTAAEWTSANPILADGELGHEKDTGLDKIGNGVDDWNTLSYRDSGGSMTDAEVKIAYENNANTNAFTDAEKTNLANQSGTNTGDQDISGIATNASAISAIQGEQTSQNDAIALNTAKVGVTVEEANPDVVPQAEAEAGTATTERIWTAERVKQAIDALSPSGSSTMATTSFVPYNTITSTDGQAAVEELKDELDAAIIGNGAGVSPQSRTTAGGETTWVVAGGNIPDTHQLFANGTKLVKDADYTISGDTFTFDASYLPIGIEEQEYYPHVSVVGNLDTTNNSIIGDSQTAIGDGTTTIDWSLGNTFNFQFGAFNEVFTFTNPSKAGTFILKLVQDSVGSRTVTFPASVKWSGGTAPTLTTTATTGTDIITFYFDGTDYFAVEVLDFS